MKKILMLFSLTWLSSIVFGQFPTPVNFSVEIEYVDMDGMGWTDCGGTVLTAPAYCTRFRWESPDTLSTESTLKHYNIYQNGTYVFSVDKTHSSHNYCGALTGKLHITAYYEDPEGESNPSNLVEMSDNLPIGIKSVDKYGNTFAYYNQVTKRIEIKSCSFEIEQVAIYNLSGRLIIKLRNENTIKTENFLNGFYLIEIRDSKNEIHKQKLLVN